MSRAVAGPLNPFLARFCGSPPDQVGGPLELGAPIATKGEGRSGYEHPLGTGPLLFSRAVCHFWKRPCDKQV
jgi:hypothetical protein